jgi:hypothetical protein
MKPKVGRVIYTIYDPTTIFASFISQDTVSFVGKDSFFVGTSTDYESLREYKYNDYGETWFTTFTTAKQYVKNYHADHGIKIKIIPTELKGYWEVEYRE